MIVLCFCGTSGLRAQPDGGLKLLTTRTCYFGGETAVIRTTVANETGAPPVLTWRLVAKERTVGRGSEEMVSSGEEALGVFEITVPLPSLEPGVVQALSLEATYGGAGSRPMLTYPIYVFSRDPFAGRQRWLERLDIKLFDHEEKTAELFDRTDIPYSRLLDLAAVELLEEGILVVGEGVSFAEHRMLPDSLCEAARRGVNVLCLAPIDGEFPLGSASDSSSQIPSQLTFGRADFFRAFDKRFDALPAKSRLTIVSSGDQVVLSVNADEGTWTWADCKYQNEGSTARLLLCTWGIIHGWEDTPVCRYLLDKLFQELLNQSLPEEATKNVANQN